MPEQVITVDFPISIGVVGAPDSGKAKVIQEFVDISGDLFVENKSEVVRIDNPGTYIETSFDQAMGEAAGCRDNLWAFYERFSSERKVLAEEKSYIVNGTPIDTMAHTGVYLENLMLGAQSGLVTPDSQAEVQRAQVTITELTYLFLENFRYKFAFYLPLPEKILIPGQEDEILADERYNKRIDAALRVIFNNFGIRIQMLDQPTIEEKAQTMLDTISKIVEEGITVSIEEEQPEDEDRNEVVLLEGEPTPEEFTTVVSDHLGSTEVSELTKELTDKPCTTCIESKKQTSDS